MTVPLLYHGFSLEKSVLSSFIFQCPTCGFNSEQAKRCFDDRDEKRTNIAIWPLEVSTLSVTDVAPLTTLETLLLCNIKTIGN